MFQSLFLNNVTKTDLLKFSDPFKFCFCYVSNCYVLKWIQIFFFIRIYSIYSIKVLGIFSHPKALTKKYRYCRPVFSFGGDSQVI